MSGALTTRRLLWLTMATATLFLAARPLSAATFTPTTVADLVTDIGLANTNSQSDVIDLGGGTFTLTAWVDDARGPTGLPWILADGGTTLTIRNGTIRRDTSNATTFRFLQVDSGASLVLENVTLSGGNADEGSTTFSGGAILNLGTLSIVGGALTNNSAGLIGGAILNGGTLSMSGCTVSGNVVTGLDSDGGAIYNGGTLSIGASTFSGNVTQYLGGAIYNGATITSIRNCTFSGNSAWQGAGLANAGTITALTNSTFAQNAASFQGGGLLNAASQPPAPPATITSLESCIVATNTGGDGPHDFVNFGSVGSASSNLVGIGDGSGLTNGVNGNIVGTGLAPIDPLLGPLANNGGPTATHALLAGSPAIDAGSNPAALANDQRGAPYARTAGVRTDIGAFELQPIADLRVTKSAAATVVAGTNLVWTVTATNAGPSVATSVSLSDPLPSGTTFVSLVSPSGWSCTTPAVGAGGTVSCTVASLAVSGSAVFALTTAVASTTAAGTVLSNTATVAAAPADPNPANNGATATATVAAAAPSVAIPALGPLGLLAMAALVGAAGGFALRCR